jgi:hypothetical protein
VARVRGAILEQRGAEPGETLWPAAKRGLCGRPNKRAARQVSLGTGFLLLEFRDHHQRLVRFHGSIRMDKYNKKYYKGSLVSTGSIPIGMDKYNKKIMIVTIRDSDLFRVEN